MTPIDDDSEAESFGVLCGRCGGQVYMETCTMQSGSGHDWVTAAECQRCGERTVYECEGCRGGAA